MSVMTSSRSRTRNIGFIPAVLAIGCLALVGCAELSGAAMAHSPEHPGWTWCDPFDREAPRSEEICWYNLVSETRMFARRPHQLGQPHGIWEAWYNDGSLKERIHYARGVLNGPFERWERNGTLAERRFYIQGTPHGEWTGRRSEGMHSWTLHYDMGQPTGEWVYRNGPLDVPDLLVICRYGDAGPERSVTCQVSQKERITAVETFEDRRQWKGSGASGSDDAESDARNLRNALTAHGTWLEYDDQGHIVKEASYVDGVLQGPYQEWYGPERPKRQGTYASGRQHGVWKEWDETGVLRTQIEWESGQQHGRVERWRADGSLEARGTYERERAAGTWEEHDEDGSVHRGMYRDGERHGAWTSQHASGAQRAAGEYVNGKKIGVWVEWAPNGQKIVETRYSEQGWPVGDHAEWYENGAPRLRSHYDEHGRLHGEYVAWHQSGGIELRGRYEHGMKQGPWERLDAAGAPASAAAPAGAAPEDAIVSGFYFDDELFQPIDYQVHAGCGTLFLSDRGSGASRRGLCDVAVVRSHRRVTSSTFGGTFWGYGLALTGDYGQDVGRIAVGPVLRAGLMTRSRKSGAPAGKGTYVYAQATPYVGYQPGTLASGVRLGVGYTSPWFVRRLWHFEHRPATTRSERDGRMITEVVVLPARIALSLLSHGELTYQYDRDRGSSVGFTFGMGF